jgi:hypothetical protein
MVATEIMNREELTALYESLQVNGRGSKCPRKGIYRMLNVYEGHIYRKFAMMAKANWKLAESDSYDEGFTVEIQLESFKRNSSSEKQEQLRKSYLKGRELQVHHAHYFEDYFKLSWRILRAIKVDTGYLNHLLDDDKIPLDLILKEEDSLGLYILDDISLDDQLEDNDSIY